jgi:hypothetical protein
MYPQHCRLLTPHDECVNGLPTIPFPLSPTLCVWTFVSYGALLYDMGNP